MDAEQRFCFDDTPRWEIEEPQPRREHPLVSYSRLLLFLLLTIFVLSSTGSVQQAPGGELPANTFSKRYVLIFADINKAVEVDNVLNVMERAAAADYNGIVLGHSSGEYLVLESASPAYRANFATVRDRAKGLGLKLIPLSCYPQQVTYKDPSLAEGLPCKNTPFVARNGVAVIDADGQELLANTTFDMVHNGAPTAWIVDKPGVIVYADQQVTRSGTAAARIQNPSLGDPVNGHARLVQEARVTPFRAYELSLWLKTEALDDPSMMKIYISGIDGKNSILYQNRYLGMGAEVGASQGWTKYTVYFNSLSNSMVAVYLGAWAKGKGNGRAWIDEVNLREVGLTHMVRRTSLPVTVTSRDGLTTYREGADFTVEEGQLRIPAGSTITESAKLSVSWYLFADMLEIMPPASGCCDKYYQIQDDISRRLNTLFGSPPGFMMSFDEWRVANWDPTWGDISAGAYVAKVTQKSVDLLKAINPNYELYVWSDMYDPHENAVDGYFLVNGNLYGSWAGLPKDVIVMTWTGGANALSFFADNGYQQMIAGYYDDFANVPVSLADLETAEKRGARGVIGFMYTTWEHKYDDLERVADLLRAKGRWGDGSATQTTGRSEGVGPKQSYVTK